MFKRRFNSRYLLPGLKRWIVLLIVGIIIIVFGVALLLELRPLSVISSFVWNTVRNIATLVPAHISGPIALLIGVASIASAIWFSIRTTVTASQNTSGENIEHGSILRSLEDAYRKGQGSNIVTMGGGTGLSTLLRGLKHYSRNITAVVTVGDDGGSSGVLREELKVIPPGDIRNCIVALSDEAETLSSIFQYRFSEGSLKGHSLGNLFLAALFDIHEGNIPESTKSASRVLRSGGRVLPSSQDPLHLCAKYTDDSTIEGESNIPQEGKAIKKVYHKGDKVKALPEVLKAIEQAEYIVLGPGSLFTSIIPNLLLKDIVFAIKKSKAKVLYVCNLTEDRETRDYMASDFVDAIHRHTKENIIDYILVNDPQSWNVKDHKAIKVDLDKLYKQGVQVIVRPKLHNNDGRHNPLRLARSIQQWFSSQNK